MPIYLTLSAWILLLAATKPNTLINNKHTSRFIFWSLFILITTLIISNFDKFLYGAEAIPDTLVYTREFLSYRNLSFSQALQTGDRELFFTFFSWIISKFTESIYVYLTLVWLFVAFISIRSFKLIFNQWQTMLVFFTYVNFPFFIAYIVNGMRQGFAMAFILLAICLLVSENKKRIPFFGILLLSVLSHVAALPFALILIFLRYFKGFSLKLSLSVWFVSSLLFITGLNSTLLGTLSARFDNLAVYTQSEVIQSFSGVNRIDFLLFSFIFLVIGLVFYKKISEHERAKYKIMLNAYIIFNAVFILLGFIAFSNRLSAFSWFLIPLLIWYPILSIGESKKYNSILIVLVTLISVLIGLFSSTSGLLF